MKEPRQFQDQEAEQLLLAAVLRDYRLFDELAALIEAEDFSTFVHRLIWQALTDLRLQGAALTAVAVHDHVSRHRDDFRPGFLAELAVLKVSGAEARTYARIIRRLAFTRKLIYAAESIIEEANTGQREEDLLEFAQRDRCAGAWRFPRRR